MQKYVPLVKQNVMKLEVFILGGQRIEKEGMVERDAALYCGILIRSSEGT